MATNADKIRQMTDEELQQILGCPYPICPDLDLDEDCKDCRLEWLQEEANDD